MSINNFPIPVETLASGLYIVSTPIGNLKDITLRAIHILSQVDFIACEDTRTSRTLLSHYNISTSKLLVYHDFSNEKQRQSIIEHLHNNHAVALISDAGTPLISDPGYKLVQACIDNNIQIFPIPGASALLAGLVVSGMPTDKFMFVGFIDHKNIDFPDNITTIGYVSCHDVIKTLQAIHQRFGNNVKISLSREITKIFEGTFYGSAEAIIGAINAKAKTDPKIMGGEWVIIMFKDAPKINLEAIKIAMIQMVKQYGVKQTVAMAVDIWAVPKKVLYQMALDINKDG